MLEPTKNKILKFTKVGLVVAILGVTTLAVSYQGITKLEKQEQNRKQATEIPTEFTKVASSVWCGNSYAIDKNQNLWGWGSNEWGQLGDGTTTDRTTPIQIKSGTKFKEVGPGQNSCLAIDTSGNLWGWGNNEYGQLGDGTTTDRTTPIIIKSGTTFNKVSGNARHSLAIDTNGNLWTWGNNGSGELGDGTTTDRTTPIQIKSGTKFKEVSAGHSHSLAIDTSGNLWGWGNNEYGALGDGTTKNRTTPIIIKSGTTFKKISAGIYNSLAIDTNGNLWAWGNNAQGELGDGTTTDRTTPIIIKSGTKFSEVSAGYGASFAIDTSGNLWAWGKSLRNYTDGVIKKESLIPVHMKQDTKFSQVSGGFRNVITLDTNETVWVSGSNIGDGSPIEKYSGKFIPIPKMEYAVTLNANGGTIDSEENITSYIWKIGATLPITVTKPGYTFAGWYTNSSFLGSAVTKISTTETGAKTYYAKWTANTNTAYKVEHYKQNTSLNGYVIVTADTQNLKGTTDANVTATARTYGGFTLNTSKSIRSGKVAADGSLVLKLYYDRNTYNVTLNRNGGTISSGNNITSYTYGVEQTLPTLTKSGYTFGGWYTNSSFSGSSVTKISTTETGAKTYYAKWTANTNTPYKVEHYQQNKNKEGYTLFETETKTGATDTTVNATSKTYTGFTYNQNVNGTVRSGKVSADGSLVLKLYYDRNTYNVTLNRDGGTISSGSNITSYTYGVEVNLPTLTKTGYTFAGWYTNSSFSGSPVTKIGATDTGAKEYYAKWTANTNTSYKVEYYKQNLAKNGYDKVEEDSKTLTGTTGASVTAEDKAYAGFSLNEASSVRTGTILGNGSLVLRMYYDRNTYHVTLNPGEGTLPEGSKNIDFTYGEEKPLPTPEKEGYDFTGWYDKDGNKVEKITPEDVGDKEYTARYEIKTYTVTFVSDGQTVGTQTVNHGSPVTAPSLTKPGYTLSWDKDLSKVTSDMTVTAIWTAGTGTVYKVEYYKQNLAKNGYDKVEEDSKTLTGTTGASVTAEDKAYAGFSLNEASSVRTGTILGNGSLVLRMYYDRNTYHVTLNPGEGTLPEESKNINFTYGEEKPLPTPEKEGYDFTGWYDKDGNKVEKITPEDIGDKEYTARYEIKTYTVTFVSDGQTVGTQTVNHGSPVTAPSLTKPGYTLSWDKDLTRVTGNITATAIWTAKDGTAYKIEYYHQNLAKTGYELVQTETLTGKTGDTVTVVEGKAFRGFSENKTHPNRVATGVILGDGTFTLKLYYDRSTYKITLDPGEGTLPEDSKNIDYTYGEEKELPTPERPGYIFDGWYDDDGNKVDKIKPSDAGDKNYHASWVKEDEYYITSPKYEINKEENYIMRVSPNTAVTVFLSNIRTNGTPKVLNAKKEEVEQDSLVGTGYILQVDYKGTIYEYEIAVRGDLDGNGKVTVTDLSMLNQALVKRLELTGMRKIAGDIDYNKEVSVTDLSMMNQYFVKKIEL